LTLAWLARHEAALPLSQFASALGVKQWATSHLVIAAQRRAEKDRAFRNRLERIQNVLPKITSSQT